MRFLAKIAPQPNGCWLWTGAIRDGYGRFSVADRLVEAHRFAYEQWIGLLPDGVTVDHRCRNRACQNPDHLRALTNQENILLGVGPTAENARKTHCIRGHPLSGDNLLTRPNGWRTCRTCERARRVAA